MDKATKGFVIGAFGVGMALICPARVIAAKPYVVMGADVFCAAMRSGMGQNRATRLMVDELEENYLEEFLADYKADKRLWKDRLWLQIARHGAICECGPIGGDLKLR